MDQLHCTTVSIRRELLRIAMAQKKKQMPQQKPLKPKQQPVAVFDSAAAESVRTGSGEAEQARRNGAHHHQYQASDVAEDMAGPLHRKSSDATMLEEIEKTPFSRSPRPARFACSACTFVAKPLCCKSYRSIAAAMAKKQRQAWRSSASSSSHIDLLETVHVEPQAEDLAGPSANSAQTSSSAIAMSLPLKSPCSTCTSVSLLHHRHRKLPGSTPSSSRLSSPMLSARKPYVPTASITECTEDDPASGCRHGHGRHFRQRHRRTSTSSRKVGLDDSVITEVLQSSAGCSSQYDVITEILPSPKSSTKKTARWKKTANPHPPLHSSSGQPSMDIEKQQQESSIKDINVTQSPTDGQTTQRSGRGNRTEQVVQDSVHRRNNRGCERSSLKKRMEEGRRIRTSDGTNSSSSHGHKHPPSKLLTTFSRSRLDDCSSLSSKPVTEQDQDLDLDHRKNMRLSVEVFPAATSFSSPTTRFGVKIVQQLPPNDLSPRFSVSPPPFFPFSDYL